MPVHRAAEVGLHRVLPDQRPRHGRRGGKPVHQILPARLPLLLSDRQDGDGARDLAPCSRGENSGEAKKQIAVGRWSAAESKEEPAVNMNDRKVNKTTLTIFKF